MEETGRVTRLMRKRLASVDKETSSRPGTPNTHSPTRPVRMTRRNSVSESTPSKTPSKTPAKSRGAVTAPHLQSQLGTPDVASPVRRSRRRSTSVTEEDKIVTRKSVSKPNFDTLTEEDDEVAVFETRRVTRLQSKSPNPAKSPNTTMSPTTAKSPTTHKSPQSAKSPIAKKSPRAATSPATGKSPTTPKSATSPKSTTLDNSTPSDNSPTKSPNATKSPQSAKSSPKQPVKSPKPGPLSSKRKSKNASNYTVMDDDIQIICVASEDETDNNEPPGDIPKQKEQNSPQPEAEQKLKTPPPNIVISEVTSLSFISPASMTELRKAETASQLETAEATVVSSSSPSRNSDLGRTAVQFNASPEADKKKMTYPKTPAVVKSKSYIEATEDSDDDDKKEHSSFHSPKSDGVEVIIPETQMDDDEEQHMFYDTIDYHAGEKAMEHIDEGHQEEETSHQEAEIEEINKDISIKDTKTPHRLSAQRVSISSSTPLVQAKAFPDVSTVPLKDSTTVSDNESDTKLEEGPNNSTKMNDTKSRKSSPKKTPKKDEKETLVEGDKKPEHEENIVILDESTVHDKDEVLEESALIGFDSDPTEDIKNLKNAIKTYAWGKSVHGSGKIDSIGTNDILNNDQELKVDESKEIGEDKPERKSLNSFMVVDDNDGGSYEPDNEQNLENDEDEEHVELAEGEKPYQRNYFVDDEAMEVDENYRSGDSMDEEERREMEENEIPLDGESLGSEDTDHEEDHDDEEEDEDNASFIVTDSMDDEENIQLEFSEDEYEQSPTKTSYKRIQLMDSDSDEEEQPKTAEDNQDDGEKSELQLYDGESALKEPRQQAADSTGDDHETSKLSDAASRLHNFDVDEHNDDEDDRTAVESLNASRKRILNKLNKSDRFNKTVQDLDVTKAEQDSISTETNESSASINPDLRNMINDVETMLDNESVVDCANDEVKAKAEELQGMIENLKKRRSSTTNKRKSLNRSVYSEIDGDAQEADTKDKRKSLNASARKEAFAENENNVSLGKSKKRKSSSSIMRPVEDDESEGSDGEDMKNTSISRGRKMSWNKFEINDGEDDKDTSDPEGIDSYEMEIKCAASLNHSVAFNTNDGDDSSSTATSESEEENVNTSQMLPKQRTGLSASFSYHKQNRRDSLLEVAMHNSFSISGNNSKKLRPLPKRKSIQQVENSDSEQEEQEQEEKAEYEYSDGSTTESKRSGVEEELERLKRIEVVSRYLANERRKTLDLPVHMSEDDDSYNTKKKLKRKSLGVAAADDGFNPSQSLIENIEERKRSLAAVNKIKRKRLSKSFSGSLGGDVAELGGSHAVGLDDSAIDEIRHMHKKSKISKDDSIHLPSSTPFRKESATGTTSSHDNDDNNNVAKILSRCEQILEKANLAKLEAKLNYNKSKVRVQPKKKQNKKYKQKMHQANVQSTTSTDGELSEPSRPPPKMPTSEEKRAAVERALKTAAHILVDKKSVKARKQTQLMKQPSEDEAELPQQTLESKKLPSQFLKSLAGQGKKHTFKGGSVDHFVHNDQENYLSHEEPPHKKKKLPSVVSKNAAGKVVEMPATPVKSKKAKIRKLQLPSGIICEEPLTPIKTVTTLRGIRESPVTPKTLGFKVRQILGGGRDAPPSMPSGSSSQHGGHKRKRHIEEPKRTLAKPTWTQSGVFLEEDTSFVHHTNSTKFTVAGLKSKKKLEGAASALEFKQSALTQSNIPRESSRALLQRRERRHVNSHF